MTQFKTKNIMKLQNLTSEELINISGGNEGTDSFLYFIGFCVKAVVNGLRAGNGHYPGNNQ